ncbi:MAG: hypothetical protein FWG88_05955 [Oscillospiraceae bacterium]|nr:hypothetical protein [Oscillospiraceae bacterium]
MSSKRIVTITIIGILFIAALIGFMYLRSFFAQDSTVISLPSPSNTPERNDEVEILPLDKVEISQSTIQDVVSQTIERPDTYSRVVRVEKFWEYGQTVYFINIDVTNGMSSLTIHPPIKTPSDSSEGVEKRIISANGLLYIWNLGDNSAFIGTIDPDECEHKTIDEWHMLMSYECLLSHYGDSIIDAGYFEYGGENCVFIEYRTSQLGNLGRLYISIEQGLIVGALEYDETDTLIYSMTAGDCLIGDTNPAAFILPDGTSLLADN